MSKRNFLVSIDLNRNELLNPVLHNQTSHPIVTGSSGYTYFNSTDKTVYTYAPGNPNSVSDWLNLGLPEGAGVTDLTYTASTRTLYSSTGTDVILPLVDGSNAGLMASADKTLLDTITNYVPKALFDANTILFATTDNTPTPLTVGTNTVVGRIGGSIQAITIDSDLTTVSASDDTIASAKSIKAYVDNSVAGQLVYQGGYNAGTNTPDLEAPVGGVVNKGFTYTVTFSGNFFTEAVQIGDLLISEVDNPSVLTDWTIVNKNIPDIVDASETEKGLVKLFSNTVQSIGANSISSTASRTYGSQFNGSGQLVVNVPWTDTNQLTTFNLTGDTGTSQIIAHNDTLNIAGGTLISTVIGATDTVTINHDNVTRNDGTSSQSPTHGGTFDVVDSVTSTAQGHITAINVKTVTLPSIDSNIPRKFSQDLTGTTTSHVVTHNLGTRDISATVYTSASTYDVIDCEIRHTTTTTATFNFNTAPTSGEYRVVIIG